MTLYSVSLMSPSASSFSRAVSTLNPCSEKYSLIEKQIDSSSSTTKIRGIGVSLDCVSSRLTHIRLSLPDTFFNFRNRFCFTAHRVLSAQSPHVCSPGQFTSGLKCQTARYPLLIRVRAVLRNSSVKAALSLPIRGGGLPVQTATSASKSYLG